MSDLIVDLRSDTVTRPDAEMRRAMADAEVGDDVYREDPTVRRLEELVAAVLGTEEALFVPTGTMGNQIALHLHGRPGTEVVGEAGAHVFHYEMGAMAALSGLFPRPIAGAGGLLDPIALEAAVAEATDTRWGTSVLSIENTHNMAGGVVTPPERLDQLLHVADRYDLACHLDGARLFNAAVALEVPARRLAEGFDSVMVALSKGLGAPAGSLLCGSRAFVEAARRVRKMFGGGMRQVGVLAAAGLVAVERGFDHLAEDHENARRIAAAVADLPGVAIDPDRVETNIVIARLDDEGPTNGATPAARWVRRAADAGVLVGAIGPLAVRLVTHRDAPRRAVDEAIVRLRAAFA